MPRKPSLYLVFYYFCWNSYFWMLIKVLTLLLNSLFPVFTSPCKALTAPIYFLSSTGHIPSKSCKSWQVSSARSRLFYFSQLPSAASLNREHPHCQSFMQSPQLLWRNRAVITHPKPYLLKSKKEAVKKEPNHYKNNGHNSTTTPIVLRLNRFYVSLISYQEILEKAYTSL